TQLTFEEGLDDGPEYSPDGRLIYFNSVRSGQMKIWKMNADGTHQVQVSPDDSHNDWFAHPSPDGRHLVFISYDEAVAPGDHPPNKHVKIRMMSTQGTMSVPETLVSLFGGQGTINVPSWSPDSKQFAFVSYRLE
ncbi:MAG: transporter, partial [Bacteroidota bacterium]